MRNDVHLIAKALDFAARKHAGQKRKGSGDQPYLNHLAEVALLVSQATGGDDGELIAAALLHDVVEDQDVTIEELSSGFGPDVASLVREVTDDKSMPTAERKRRQIESTPHKSERAQLLKIADKLSNLGSLREDPPSDWPLERLRCYLDWARQVVDGARGVSPPLERAFDEAARQFEASLKRTGSE